MKILIKHFSLLLFPACAMAQQTPVLTLDTILARISRNNVSLQAYEDRVQSYKYRADAATAWMAPMVGAGTFMTPYPGEKVMEARDRGNIMLQIEQDIPNPAKLRARKSYIESQADVVSAEKQINYNELRSQAKLYYYNWLVAKNRLSVLSETERLMTTMKRIEEVRYPYNQSRLSGVYSVTAKLEENNNMIRMQEGIVLRARKVLLAMMNEDPAMNFEIDTVMEYHFVPPPINDTALIATARKDILKMNSSIRSMRLNIASMQSERKPDFRVRLDHMTPLSKMMPNAFNIMAMISIPIVPWASKMYRSEINAMELEIKSLEKQRAGMLQESYGMLNGMQSEIQSMHDRVLAMEEKIIPVLQKALDANYLLYQENRLQLAEVINSWEALNMMRMSLLDEKLKHYQMIVEYEKELFQ